MAQDVRCRILQVEQIQPIAPEVVSGDSFIPVAAKLRYTQGFDLQDDYDLVYKSWIEAIIGSGYTYFTNSDTPGISSNLATGVVTVTMATFPIIASNGIIRGNFDVRVGSDWVALDVMPEVTKDWSGTLTTAIFVFNQSFDEIRGRIF